MNTSPITGIARNETTADQIARIERLILADRAERKEAIAKGDERTAEVLANSIMNRMERVEALEGEAAARRAINDAVANGDEQAFDRANEELAEILRNKPHTPKSAPVADVPTRSFNI